MAVSCIGASGRGRERGGRQKGAVARNTATLGLVRGALPLAVPARGARHVRELCFRPMTPEEFARARRALMRRDPILAPVIRKYRTRSLLDTPPADPFPALVRTITSQQISTKAAATIHGRLVALLPRGVTPQALLALTDEQLRAAGLSRQKTVYLRD